jgi:hypothetical protein
VVVLRLSFMIAVNRILLAAAVMTTVVAGHSQTSASTDTAQANDALTLVARIPVPQMTGTWDHLTVDPVTDRFSHRRKKIIR